MRRSASTHQADREKELVESVSGESEKGGGDMFSRNHIFTGEDFFRLLDLEIKRARRYQNLFGIVRFELKESRRTGTKNQAKNLKFMLKLLGEEIRETDLLGQTRRNEVMILLPYCDSSGSEVVYRRLNGLIRDFHFGNKELKVTSGFVSFPMEGTDMTEILKKLQTLNINGSTREGN